MTTHHALLLLASNTPNREEALAAAQQALSGIATAATYSPLYITDAVGATPAPPYANCVGMVECSCSYEELHDWLKALEASTGRTPQSKLSGLIPLDVDIVMWDDTLLRPKDWEQSYFQMGYLALCGDSFQGAKHSLQS